MENKIKELEEKLLRKEQECEELKSAFVRAECQIADDEILQCDMREAIEGLKAEVKSKTEYIQEQRDIINQYSKEIEMYKKCQGKRASKREEELKAENKRFKETLDELFKIQYKLADNNKKLRQTLTEIKEIAEKQCNICEELTPIDEYKDCKKCWQGVILQKISECEDNQ